MFSVPQVPHGSMYITETGTNHGLLNSYGVAKHDQSQDRQS